MNIFGSTNVKEFDVSELVFDNTIQFYENFKSERILGKINLGLESSMNQIPF